MNELEINNSIFESIKHIDKDGCEYWFARELKDVLGYSQWRRFNEVIEKAKITCRNSNYSILDHFADVGKMVRTGDSIQKILDYKLSRYSCYLIAQNGDSRRSLHLQGTYFAIQTRRQELLEKEYSELTEDEDFIKEI